MDIISKCTGEGCAKKETCVRFTSPAAAKYQPWMIERVAIPDKSKCRFYWNEEIENAIIE